MRPLVSHHRPVAAPGLPALLDRGHPGAKLVAYLSRIYPDRTLTRQEAMDLVGIAGTEPRCFASFEWKILRINDSLPRAGWYVDDSGERYRLAPIRREKP